MDKKCMRICVVSFFLIALTAVGLVSFTKKKWEEPAFEKNDYDAVYCTMREIPDFTQEDFEKYRGLNVVVAQKNMETFSDISDMFHIVLENNPDVNTIYLELDPVLLWGDAGSRKDDLQQMMGNYLLSVMRENVHITFEILLPYPKITYWIALSENERSQYMDVYHSFVECFDMMGNVFVSYAGAEEWLNGNEKNYVDTFKLNKQVEKHIFLSVFCDRSYLANSATIVDKLQAVQEQVEAAQADNITYPDYSEWEFVFFGDSIIGLDKSSKSISGVVGAFTGANIYNLGINGSSAAISDNEIAGFLETIDLFLDKKLEGDKICFFINYGLNDYFQGHGLDSSDDPYDIKTYAGAMRFGIEKLRDAYPQSHILVMVPTYIHTYDEGRAIQGEFGETLAEYREMAKQVAEEMQVHCKDNYQDLGIDASNQKDYLSDECHLNEKGKYLLGKQLVFFLTENVIK